ncbi:hypothetical protein [Propylenella binzhouense]|uniref:Pyrrolidone-carboxylate peptidase n=1 Tax=Propylenella binzhouense TaxID=2555902 RepID=A0A964WVI9_9HYPH|nr:hypothetical protein [Propylenella binzhouense]MYZ50103.1 hypothetical protein [Propylenella binzhouense]
MTVLLLGFEPYGGRSSNPAEAIARTLDGETIGGLVVRGRVVPVRHEGLAAELARLFAEVRPQIVIGLGLWPGSAIVRIERIAVNIADFEIADNAGARICGAVEAGGPTALAATLPIRAIRARLLEAGIPSALSNGAGTFLCNALMYRTLRLAAEAVPRPSCGFLHLPHSHADLAAMMEEQARSGRPGAGRLSETPSMELAAMVRAVRLAIETAASAGRA